MASSSRSRRGGRVDRRDACSTLARYSRAAVKRLAMKVRTPMRVWGKRVTNLSPQFDCFTFSPSANLMPGGAASKIRSFRAGAVAQLDDAALAADRVGRAVEQVDGGDAAGELLVKVVGLGIHHVADADHGGRGQRRFVDPAENGRVAVGINQAGRDVQALAVNHQRVRRGLDLAQIPDPLDLPAGNEHLGIGQNAVGAAGPDRRALNQDCLGLGQRPASFQRRARHPCLLQLAQLLLLLVPGFARGFSSLGCRGLLLLLYGFRRRFGFLGGDTVNPAVNPNLADFAPRDRSSCCPRPRSGWPACRPRSCRAGSRRRTVWRARSSAPPARRFPSGRGPGPAADSGGTSFCRSGHRS